MVDSYYDARRGGHCTSWPAKGQAGRIEGASSSPVLVQDNISYNIHIENIGSESTLAIIPAW